MSFACELTDLILLHCQIFPKTVVSLEDEISLLLNHCVICFM